MSAKTMAMIAAALALLLSYRVASAGLVPINEAGDVITPSTTVNASATVFLPGLVENSFATDGQLRGDTNNALVFNGGPEILSLSGFTPTALAQIRVWTLLVDPPRVSTSVTIRSSTSLVGTLVAADYETLLGTFTPLFVGLPPAGTDENYANFSVAAPAGTQSLYFDFDSPTGTRVSEVEAFLIPEPASAAALVGAAITLCGRRRRA